MDFEKGIDDILKRKIDRRTALKIAGSGLILLVTGCFKPEWKFKLEELRDEEPGVDKTIGKIDQAMFALYNKLREQTLQLRTVSLHQCFFGKAIKKILPGTLLPFKDKIWKKEVLKLRKTVNQSLQKNQTIFILAILV